MDAGLLLHEVQRAENASLTTTRELAPAIGARAGVRWGRLPGRHASFGVLVRHVAGTAGLVPVAGVPGTVLGAYLSFGGGRPASF